LKHNIFWLNIILLQVAPLAGAWIETYPTPLSMTIFLVAPLAGAWIETKEKAKQGGVV